MSWQADGKSPAKVSFYRNILSKFEWWLGNRQTEVKSVHEFIVYIQTTTSCWGSNGPRANAKVGQTTVQTFAEVTISVKLKLASE